MISDVRVVYRALQRVFHFGDRRQLPHFVNDAPRQCTQTRGRITNMLCCLACHVTHTTQMEGQVDDVRFSYESAHKRQHTLNKNVTSWSEIADYKSTFARNASAVASSEKSSINNKYRKSTTRFPMSLR